MVKFFDVTKVQSQIKIIAHHSPCNKISFDEQIVLVILLGPGPAPRGAFQGLPPQLSACAPPSKDCAPKKLTGSGLLECKSRPKLVFGTRIFVIFVDLHQIWQNFWDDNLFFLEGHLFSGGKTV